LFDEEIMKKTLLALFGILCYAHSVVTAATIVNTNLAGSTLSLAIPLVGEDKPDLLVKALRLVPHHSNYTIGWQHTIINIGDVSVELADITVQAVVSADQVFNNAGDKFAGGVRAGQGQLQPGQIHERTFGSSVSFDPASHPYLVVMVDYGNNVDELDENNNTRAIPIIDERTSDFPDPRLEAAVEMELGIVDPNSRDLLTLPYGCILQRCNLIESAFSLHDLMVSHMSQTTS